MPALQVTPASSQSSRPESPPPSLAPLQVQLQQPRGSVAGPRGTVTMPRDTVVISLVTMTMQFYMAAM